ncbi:HD domain-containing phosphohydrolase [Candidatus Symbiobacter mobilis]|uniref:Response regulator-like protein n=1 Tax=Candidatus Symbiobacter mobilis CR TaxID=946483 RepID=U5NBK5_9BURK|nr:HD domain-containing phosphohydrolase [Candidatus Symbiobacter mobilis]AGX87623.1 response regulator-like protein [Candidatus Symbiobacter mobilis CR]
MTAPPYRIFAIDDEPDNLLLIRQALRQLGHPLCETESDPVRAIERFLAEDFDLVLLDYNMPGLSGLGVLHAIADKSRSEQIPVVMVTAQIDRDTRLQTLGAGAKDFLGKPIDLAELKVRVHNLLETRTLNLALRQHNQHLEEVVHARTEELRSTQLEVIRRLARAAEFRDTDTGLHIQRMSLFAQAIGREMGMSTPEHELLLNASPMHDLGKIGISDRILLKPGKLTPEEYATMQEHTLIGANILQGHDSELLRTAHDIALWHHERWNGDGYPNGLHAQQIPLPARIAAVADVFDALTMVRPYKSAWPTEEAYREVCRLAGNHFDPDVVLAFDACFEEILHIRHANPDPAR